MILEGRHVCLVEIDAALDLFTNLGETKSARDLQAFRNECEAAGVLQQSSLAMEVRTYRGPHEVQCPNDGGPIAKLKEMDIIELASRYTELKPAGLGKLKGCCPIHQERTPSFYIYDSARWQCYGACASGGDVIELLQRLVNAGAIQ